MIQKSVPINKITLKESFIIKRAKSNFVGKSDVEIVINRTVSFYQPGSSLSLTMKTILPTEETYGYFCKKKLN